MDYSGKIITKNPVEPSQTSAPGVWTLDQATQAVQGNNWPIAYVPNPISRSLRFNPADTAYLSRTFGTPTNNKKWTMSGWMKRSAINDGNYNTLFSRYADGNNFMRVDLLGDNLRMYQYKSANDVLLRSTLVLRDPSAWYHFVVVYDSDNATSSNRVLFYINNTQITSFSSSTYPSSGSSSIWNTSGGATHQIGTFNANGVGEAFSGYMTETNFIDGQALDPTYFGMTDPRTGAWIPKKYSGTYGTNGFYLNFSDNASTAALGTDYSGNSNTWTTNGFSVTTGSGNDSMTDVPTPWIPYNTTGDVGGVVRGNYATLNPLFVNTSYPITYSNGNLDAARASGGQGGVTHTFGMSSGKWYWEVVFATYVYNIGITTNPAGSTTGSEGAAGYNGGGGTSIGLQPNGVLRTNGTAGSTYTSWTTGDVMGIALDMDGGNLYFYKNGTAMNSGSPVATSLTGSTWFFITSLESGASLVANFGQRPFAYTPPAGFKSLCTTNLPEPTVLDGGDYFNVVTWSGASSGSSLNVTGFGFQPDFIWTKNRNDTYAHYLQDAVRGIGVGNQNTLSSNSTADEADTAGLATSFLDDGFNINSTSGPTSLGNTQVTWAWKAGGTGVSVAAGDSNYGSPSLASTLSVNTTAGFSISTYTGNNTSGATVAHGLKVDGLGVAPAMVICKNRTAGIGSGAWPVWHKSLSGGNYYLFLNTTAAQANGNNNFTSAPTSTLVNLGTSDTNNTADMVMYCFAAVPGFSAFGSYTGNGSSDGPFVYTGFRVRWLLVKETTPNNRNWMIFDAVRSPYNQVGLHIMPNSSDPEGTGSGIYNQLDFLSNGVKFRAGTNSEPTNESGATYIYAAFAENPFKYSNAR